MSNIRRRLTHTVNVHKSAHVLAGKRKATEWVANAVAVPARVDPLSDTPSITLLGKTATETYRIYFEADADVEEGDKVVWLDRTPSQTFLVRTVQAFSGLRASQADHLEATAVLQTV